MKRKGWWWVDRRTREREQERMAAEKTWEGENWGELLLIMRRLKRQTPELRLSERRLEANKDSNWQLL